MLALARSLTARFPGWSNRTRIPRSRRSRALEITGACPAPGRFFSELLTLHKRASDFQRYQVSLSTHFPNGKTDSKSRLHFSGSQCACPALPILSMVGWNLFSPQLTWPRPSLKSKKFHLNTLIRMTYNNICKTTHLSTVNNSILMFFRPTIGSWTLLVFVYVCFLPPSYPPTATQVY